MAKTRLNDFDTVAANNTDVGNVGIQGSNVPSNLDDALRSLMSIIKAWVAGTPVYDTANFCDPDDTSKVFRIDAGNIATATTRTFDAEHLYQVDSLGPRPITTTYYTSAASAQPHTFNTKAKYYRVFLMGAGGDGGNVDGQTPDAAGSASGGNSGNWGWTTYLSLSGITTATYTVGAAGTAVTTAGANGCDGNDTTWTDGTNTYTVKGGKGGIGVTASGQYLIAASVENSANTGTVFGNYSPGNVGAVGARFAVAVAGGSTDYGRCLSNGAANGEAKNGLDASGNGAGGGGAAAEDSPANGTGGRGAPGMIIVEEF